MTNQVLHQAGHELEIGKGPIRLQHRELGIVAASVPSLRKLRFNSKIFVNPPTSNRLR